MEQSFKQAEELGKEVRYEAFLPQLRTLLEGETDWVSILANTSAALKEAFGFFWVGFYIVRPGLQKTMNWCWDLFRAVSPVSASGRAEGYAVRHGSSRPLR